MGDSILYLFFMIWRSSRFTRFFSLEVLNMFDESSAAGLTAVFCENTGLNLRDHHHSNFSAPNHLTGHNTTHSVKKKSYVKETYYATFYKSTEYICEVSAQNTPQIIYYIPHIIYYMPILRSRRCSFCACLFKCKLAAAPLPFF